MNDNDIIKALEEMVEYPHYYEEGQQLKKVLDLINRQKAEIERLKELLKGWKTEAYKVAKEKDELYCNAVERLKDIKFQYAVLQKNYGEVEQQLHYLSNVEIPYLYSFTEDKDKKLQTLAKILLNTREKAVKEFAERLRFLRKI